MKELSFVIKGKDKGRILKVFHRSNLLSDRTFKVALSNYDKISFKFKKRV